MDETRPTPAPETQAAAPEPAPLARDLAVGPVLNDEKQALWRLVKQRQPKPLDVDEKKAQEITAHVTKLAAESGGAALLGLPREQLEIALARATPELAPQIAAALGKQIQKRAFTEQSSGRHRLLLRLANRPPAPPTPTKYYMTKDGKRVYVK